MSKSSSRVRGAVGLPALSAAGLLWLYAGCVDLTRPWDQVTSDGAGGAGAGGAANIDGALATGGMMGFGGNGWDRGSGAGMLDAPLGGAIDARLGGAGGSGIGIDGPPSGAGGDLIDGGDGPDVSSPGAGGSSGTPDASTNGGASGGGGTTQTAVTGAGGGTRTGGTTTGGGKKTGGTTGSGGAPRTGGASGTGGRTGTGGTGSGGTSATGGTKADGAQPDLSPLANGLLAYYPCESANGTLLPDRSGNANDATLSATGSYSFDPGKIGNAVTLLKANSGYIAMPPAIFRGLSQITIAAWVKVVTATNWQRVFDIGVNAGLTKNPLDVTNTISYMNFVPQDYTGTDAAFAITNTGCVNEKRLTTAALAAGSWRHVALVLSGSTGTLYVDGGSPDGGSVAESAISLRPADLGTIDYAFIGRSQYGEDPYFDGMIDELRIYSRALSAAEVQAVYNFAGP